MSDRKYDGGDTTERNAVDAYPVLLNGQLWVLQGNDS